MDWTKSYTARWRVFRVNRKTWADGMPLLQVDRINVTRTSDGSLLESGEMTLSGDFESDYYRIVMTAEQGDEIERVDVATLLFNVTGGTVNYGHTTHNVEGFSVLYPASVTAVDIGEYAPAGTDGVIYVRNLLKKTINAPIETSGTFLLNDHIVFELGTTVLEAAWTVLSAGNFVMQIDGKGIVRILPMPTEPALIFSSNTSSLLMNGVDFSASMSEIPNRYVVIDETLITIAENNDEKSIVSTVNRGYNVDMIDTSPTPVNGETNGEYADRMLKQFSVLKEEKNYMREYSPDVYPYSIIRASVDGLEGDLRVNAQVINCEYGITLNETSFKETQLW